MEQRVEIGQQHVAQGKGLPHGLLCRLAEPVRLLRLQWREWRKHLGSGTTDSEVPPPQETQHFGPASAGLIGTESGIPQGMASPAAPALPGCSGHCGSAWRGRRPPAGSSAHTAPPKCCPGSHRCRPPPGAPPADWRAGFLEGRVRWTSSCYSRSSLGPRSLTDMSVELAGGKDPSQSPSHPAPTWWSVHQWPLHLALVVSRMTSRICSLTPRVGRAN